GATATATRSFGTGRSVSSPGSASACRATSSGPTSRSRVPEAAELVSRAAVLRPMLVERQAETERRTYYDEDVHRAFLDAGFYRLLVPKRYGGYEVDLPTFLRVIVEVARGCPSTAWCLCLGAGHALQVGSLFEEQAQGELFADPDFRC